MKELTEEHFAILRRHMVEMIAIHVDLASEELGKAALDQRVRQAMRRVPRHRFVPAPLAPYAYQDTPLPIGFDKTISQPFIVAVMTDLLEPRPDEVVLEIGTGLGYQAAVRPSWPARSGASRSSRSSRPRPRRSCGTGLRQCRHPRRRRLARVGRARAFRQDHRDRGGRADAAGPARAAQARRPHGAAHGTSEMQGLTVIDKDAAGGIKVRKFIPVRFSQLETVQ